MICSSKAEEQIVNAIAKGNEKIESFLCMAISCLTYGSFNYDFYQEKTDELVGYGEKYAKDIPNAKDIAKKIKRIFEENCHGVYGCYTDGDGCSYNSCKWDKYIPELNLKIESERD